MPNRRGRYPSEFRAEAVKLFRSVQGEKSMRTVATELGISNETLRSWIKQADIDEGRREGLSRRRARGAATPAAGEQGPQRRARDPKKAAAFFAQENGTRS
jgi:transposase